MQKTVLEAVNISKYFRDPQTVQVLKDINLKVEEGEFISVVGKSGCGKSTLLYILSTMDTDYDGDLIINGQSMKGRDDAFLANIRNEKIGFVFQFHYLLNEFTVLKNIMLPGLNLQKHSEEQLRYRAMELLHILDIKQQALKKPNQLSGGEKQRVAIARALINEPLIIMGDEPTGNLDRKNSDTVFGIFRQLADELKQTLLIVTHDQAFAEKTNRIITMDDGRIIS